MLERTAACIEPASHLFVRSFDPLVRTQRALGPSFWRNGGNQLDVAPWWPLYLEHIRASHRNKAVLESSVIVHRPSDLTPSGPRSRRPRCRPSKRSHPPTSSFTSSAPSRTTHKSIESPRKSMWAGFFADTVEPRDQSPDREGSEQDDESTALSLKSDSLGNHLHKIARDAREPAQILRPQHENQFKKLLHTARNSDLASIPNKLERLWFLFKQISDQETRAMDVFHVLAKSDRELDQIRAVTAFELTPEEKRSLLDTELAVRTAMKGGLHASAIRINRIAARNGRHDGSSVFLLLHTVSNRLWNTASAAWQTSSKLIGAKSGLKYATRKALVKEMGNYRDLPIALYDLGSKLRDQSPLIVQNFGTLKLLFNEMLSNLVQSGPLMSIITPEGLHTLLNMSLELEGRAEPFHYINALNTINKHAMRPDKGSLANALYANFRLQLPELTPHRSLLGTLLSIHARQGAPAKTYLHYLDEFAKFHRSPDLQSFHLVLKALSRQGNIDAVQRVFLRLTEAHGYSQDPKFWTPLLYAYARLGDVQGTKRELENMQSHGVEPDSSAWSILAYAYARSSKPKDAVKVLGMMKTAGIPPNGHTFTIISSVFAKVGDTDAVLKVIERAQEHQVSGSYELLTGLVQSYCLNDQADVAERLATKATGRRLSGDPTTMWNYLLRHYAFRADSTSMLRVQKLMTELSVNADAMTHTAFMTALVVLGKTIDALRILRFLNLSQTLSATAFQYSIILHGFAQEGNRDMANVIYNEMSERFPRLTASSRLAMLHVQASRSLSLEQYPKFAAEYLATTLREFSNQDRASIEPQPGLRRRSSTDAVPSLYLEYFAEFLINRGQVKRAGKLLRQFETLVQSPFLHLNNTSRSIPQLTIQLRIQASERDWSAVDATWSSILACAARKAQISGSIDELMVVDEAAGQKNVEKSDVKESLRPLPPQAVGLPDGALMTDENFDFGSMFPADPSIASPLNTPGLQILYAQRYLLDLPLHRYLKTLGTRQLQNSAMALVAQLQKVGFELTGKNWNSYIQMLTMSPDPEHWIVAFTLFEEKLMPDIAPWSMMHRGEWLPPQTSQHASTPVRRKVLERRDPGKLMSTYTTTVRLGSVLIKANRLSFTRKSNIETRLKQVARLTCRYIRRMPYLNDRLQSALLRGSREKRVLPQRKPIVSSLKLAGRSGVLGSKSPLDHIPAELSVGFEDSLKREAIDNATASKLAQASDVRRMELYQGQIPVTALSTKRRALETVEEFRRRVRRKTREYLLMLRQMRLDLSRPRVVSDSHIGHPAIPMTPTSSRKATGLPGDTLYGTGMRRVISQGQDATMTWRERQRALRRARRLYTYIRGSSHESPP